MSKKETYKKELDKTNKELKQLSNLLIETLETTPIEFINLYEFINLIDTLNTKKQKLLYIIATDI